MGSVYRRVITVSGATGGAGLATADSDSDIVINGIIMAVHLEYVGLPPAGTTDVTVVESVNDPAMPILTVSNAATDGWFYPMAQADNQAGTDITNQGREIAVNDIVNVAIAQANNDDGIVVTIVYRQ